MEKMSEGSVSLSEVLDVRQAIKSGNDKLYITSIKENDTYKPILRGKDIERYLIKDPHLYLNYGSHLACPRKPEIFEQPKLLIREAGARITATYDEDNYYIMSSLYNAILIDDSYDLKYLLGLLNSKLMQYIMNKLTFEKTKGAFTKAKIYHYYNLPIKKTDGQRVIAKLVNEILTQNQNGNKGKIEQMENKIDYLVYHLYGLTYDEVLIVDPDTPISREEYEAYKGE